MTVWMNGKKVFEKNVFRSAVIDEDAVTVTLRTGWNNLLMKISRNFGPNGFYFRIVK
jgi:hypothetical protein